MRRCETPDQGAKRQDPGTPRRGNEEKVPGKPQIGSGRQHLKRPGPGVRALFLCRPGGSQNRDARGGELPERQAEKLCQGREKGRQRDQTQKNGKEDGRGQLGDGVGGGDRFQGSGAPVKIGGQAGQKAGIRFAVQADQASRQITVCQPGGRLLAGGAQQVELADPVV